LFGKSFANHYELTIVNSWLQILKKPGQNI